MNQNTEWAKIPSAKRARVEDDSDGEDALESVVQSTQSLVAPSTTLPAQNLSTFSFLVGGVVNQNSRRDPSS